MTTYEKGFAECQRMASEVCLKMQNDVDDMHCGKWVTHGDTQISGHKFSKAILALRPEPVESEPVAWMKQRKNVEGLAEGVDFSVRDEGGYTPLYLHPTPNAESEMTFEEWDKSVRDEYGNMKFATCYEAIQAAWNAATEGKK